MIGAVVVAALLALWRLGPPPLGNADAVSITVLDRNDRLLRAYTTPDGRWRLPVEPGDVDPRYLAMLIAFEDRRFHSHPGVDPLAMLRAAGQLGRHRRIVSGGSTLTMQVARLLEGRHGRTASGKLRQMARALQIESRLSKSAILRLYLRLAPFGGNIEGVRAATLAYFGKEPKRLSPGEAALLVALPQSPESRRPGRDAAALARARGRVLARAVQAGIITAAEAEQAGREPLPRLRRDFPLLAAHLADAEIQRHPTRTVHRTTIDRQLQRSLEALTRDHATAAGERMSAAIIVADHRTGEILASVGSAGYLDSERQGAVDMATAVRSPGSTLKPFVYGLAFEAGIAHPETLIEDRPTRFGSYSPRNFDEEFHGTVTVRHALAQSLNIPAVKALEVVGPQRLFGVFQRAGVSPVLPSGAEPTLAVALGGTGLRLVDIAQLYAALANRGEAVALRHAPHTPGPASVGSDGPPGGTHRLLTAVAAWYVTDILKDAPPPAGARGGRIAYKTGTSYGYRDAWAAGYDGRHTVAVWVGRPDGASTPGLTGRTAAAPMLFDAFQRIAERREPMPPAPPAALRVSGADLPLPLRRFRDERDGADPDGPFLVPRVQISYPPDRAEIEIEQAGDEVIVKAAGGTLPLTWLIDGAPVAAPAPGSRELSWIPPGKGFYGLSVIDAAGRTDRVVVRLR